MHLDAVRRQASRRDSELLISPRDFEGSRKMPRPKTLSLSILAKLSCADRHQPGKLGHAATAVADLFARGALHYRGFSASPSGWEGIDFPRGVPWVSDAR